MLRVKIATSDIKPESQKQDKDYCKFKCNLVCNELNNRLQKGDVSSAEFSKECEEDWYSYNIFFKWKISGSKAEDLEQLQKKINDIVNRAIKQSRSMSFKARKYLDSISHEFYIVNESNVTF